MPLGHFTIIPVKPFAAGKSRLGYLLSSEERIRLNAFFFDRTVKAAEGLGGNASIIVVSRSEEVLHAAQRRGLVPVPETGRDLNTAAMQATAVARSAGATGILILPVDLPFATTMDLRRFIAAGAGAGKTLVIAPDQTGCGTNALFVSPPELDRYWFGQASFALHCNAAKAAGYRVVEQRIPGLQFDIDTPEHYRHWRQHQHGEAPNAAVALVPG